MGLRTMESFAQILGCQYMVLTDIIPVFIPPFRSSVGTAFVFLGSTSMTIWVLLCEPVPVLLLEHSDEMSLVASRDTG